ncbi:component of SufBCD complex [Wigglesworthia glossinidia endosymbiont of Glossina morsitans morsitans (Yale colony)]|uniref:Component of SufBCD complex n=1 Tax=Wigglesworthia glossinidia endosymbiont of Glossina morsitans morsitans (Yale colony) TaxID=1142511 RepID=H6Q4V8_WIGGL|nr:Fe-S cluster assembly protein SufD [Wigglesworthia glossinidia]AFA41241.1 component of SufBCD complex [Wigglesworthia glossinidia endosymbiont of Glossina morsitans morsitans (Yale colony)]
MDKLKYNTHIINFLEQWNKLFLCKKRPKDLCMHWNKIFELRSSYFSKEIWNVVPLKNFFTKKFFIANKNSNFNIELDKILLHKHVYKLVFFNGTLCQHLSDNDFGQWKIKIRKNNYIKISPNYLIKSNFFLHMSESFCENIIHIDLEKNTKPLIPLYLLHINSGGQNNKIAVINSRIHINVQENARGEIIEHFLGNSHYSYLNNICTNFLLESSAHMNYLKINFDNFNSYHIANNNIILNKNTTFYNHLFNLGGYFSQQNTHVCLNHEHSDVSINSLSVPSNKQIIDINTYIDHKSRCCKSRQLHKMILSKSAIGNFHGIIKVEKNAVKTDGHMKNDNLLTSKHSKINTKPELEIYADDVKCSHGSTVGYMNPEHLFYLRSRGISKNHAKKMIMYAFSLEVLKNVSYKSLHKTLNNLIVSFLEQIKI